MIREAAQQGVEADEAEHNGASQLNSSVRQTMASASRRGPIMNDEDFWSRLASFVSGGSVVVDRPKGAHIPAFPD